MSYIGANDLIFTNDIEGGIHTGGFSVKNIMMKGGISPIQTINNGQQGGTNKVSDLFNSDLVVPNWVYSYSLPKYNHNINNKKIDSDDEDDETIDDDLYDKLLGLVTVNENELKQKFKKTKKNMKGKKIGTKKNKINKTNK
jgi:hypothetical protein